jgi:alkylation response protein AidB-like acyl-CoA dehydrogenase
MKYLVPLAKEKYQCFLSEPEAGSDKKLLLLIKDHYLLNGTKNWITNSSASTYIVIAQTDIERA